MDTCLIWAILFLSVFLHALNWPRYNLYAWRAYHLAPWTAHRSAKYHFGPRTGERERNEWKSNCLLHTDSIVQWDMCMYIFACGRVCIGAGGKHYHLQRPQQKSMHQPVEKVIPQINHFIVHSFLQHPSPLPPPWHCANVNECWNLYDRLWEQCKIGKRNVYTNV